MLRIFNYLAFGMCFLYIVSIETVAPPTYPPLSKPKLYPDIIFPQIDDFEEDCKLNDGSEGTCRNIKHCPSALTGRSSPKTCYFERSEQFVCCKREVKPKTKKRISQSECDDTYLVMSIVNGTPTEPLEFPYMAALGWETWIKDSYQYSCGGVLVSQKFVLTAAHCARLNGLYPHVVLLGGSNLTDISSTPIKVQKVTIHPEYNETSVYNDIALLELSTPTKDFDPICLWSTYDLQDTNLTAIGYGHTKFGGQSSAHLLKTFLSVHTNDDCKTYFKPDDSLPLGIIESQLCAKDPLDYRDTCQGDSGGPLIFSVYDGSVTRPFVAGITSFGQNCAGGAPGVYARVSSYIDWIENIVWPRKS